MTLFFSVGLYCSGWLKTGPTGVIATTMNSSFDTARSLVEDMESGTLDVSAMKPGSQSIGALLEKRGTSVWVVVAEPRYHQSETVTTRRHGFISNLQLCVRTLVLLLLPLA